MFMKTLMLQILYTLTTNFSSSTVFLLEIFQVAQCCETFSDEPVNVPFYSQLNRHSMYAYSCQICISHSDWQTANHLIYRTSTGVLWTVVDLIIKCWFYMCFGLVCVQELFIVDSEVLITFKILHAEWIGMRLCPYQNLQM